MRMQFAAAAVLFALPLGGCAVAALSTAGAVGVAAAQEKSLGEAVDDATASNEIKSKLLSESANKFGEVDVEVTGGLVLLSGRVNTPEERVKAEGIAWTSHLTRDVANEIRIQPRAVSSQMSPMKSSRVGSAHAWLGPARSKASTSTSKPIMALSTLWASRGRPRS